MHVCARFVGHSAYFTAAAAIKHATIIKNIIIIIINARYDLTSNSAKDFFFFFLIPITSGCGERERERTKKTTFSRVVVGFAGRDTDFHVSERLTAEWITLQIFLQCRRDRDRPVCIPQYSLYSLPADRFSRTMRICDRLSKCGSCYCGAQERVEILKNAKYF